MVNFFWRVTFQYTQNTTISQRANTGPILRHIASKLTTAMKKGFASLSGSVIERTLWRLTMGKPRGSSS